MSLSDLTLLNALTRKMDWHEARQEVLAQNIANANTPGYKPQDITPVNFNFKELLKNSTSQLPMGNGGNAPIAPTLAMYAPDTAETASSFGGNHSGKFLAQQEKNPYEVKPDGNAVILEEQLVKMNQNFTDHTFVSNLYQKNIDMLELAVK